MKFSASKKLFKGFTLVELMVVITILAILGTIGFLQLGSFASAARDSVRLSDMKNIYSQLNIALLKQETFPMPEAYRTITLSGIIIAYQGYVGDLILSNIKIQNGGHDPKDNTYYTYIIDKEQKQAQLMGYFEEYDINKLSNVTKIFPQIYATNLVDYSGRKIGMIGKKICILVDSGTLAPVQNTNTGILDIATTTTPYLTYCDNKTVGSGTGSALQKFFLNNSVLYNTGITKYSISGTFGTNGSGSTVSVCGLNTTADVSGNFTAKRNTGSACNGIIATKFGYACSTTLDGPSNLVTNVNNIAGSCSVAIPEFETVWKVGTVGYGNGDLVVTFDLQSVGTGVIDWGDGSTGSLSARPGHTYASAGDKTINIRGNIQSFGAYAGVNSNINAGKLLSVTKWDNVAWTSMYNMFFYADHFNSIPVIPPNMTGVTSMYGIFYNATAFNQPIGNWDVSNVTNLDRTFMSATAFNQPIGNWNTSKVTSMADTFNSATTFNQPIGNWDVSNVTHASVMFADAASFNQDISSWNTSNMINMSQMFQGATAFNQPIGNWNTSKVINMSSMLCSTANFNQPIGNWDVSKVTNMRDMFFGATAFNQNINSWNTSAVTNMAWMFLNTSAFNQNISSWNVGAVINMDMMFNGATAFNQNISSWNVGAVTTHANFRGGNPSWLSGWPAGY